MPIQSGVAHRWKPHWGMQHMQQMNKRLRLPLAVALALGHASAFALGLGQIEVKSSLNQPLVAEIPVLSVTAAEAETLSVRLASAEAFARAGLERPHLLNANLSFEVKRMPSGRTVIAVTTPNQVREPFISFLLEVEWGNGKLLREYSVLLDPPSMQPVRSSAPVAATALPEPARAQPEPLAEPAAPPPAPVRPAPAPSSYTSAPAAPVQSAPSYSGDSYSVNAGDTLWSIASRTRPDAGVSVNQMMLALLRANPDAFIGNNINRLKKGAVLRIPGRDEAAATTAAEAAAQVRSQMDSWRPVGATTAQPADAPRRSDSMGSPRPTSSTGDSSRLELTPPKGEGSSAQSGASSSGEGRELRAELDRAREQVNSLKQENVELKSRVSELESLQGDSRKLIELKDSELAAAQRRLAEIEKQLAEASAAAATAAATSAQAPVETAVAPVETPAQAAETVAADSSPQGEDEAIAPFETDDADEKSAESSEPASEPVALSEAPAAPAEQPKPAEPKPAPAASAPTQESGGFNPWLIGGGALVLVGLVGLLLARRGKGEKAPKAKAGKLAAESNEVGADTAPVEDTEDAITSPGSTQAVSDQVEAELVDAISQYPSDLALHLDLLRHYFDRGDAVAFEAAAEGMYAHVYDSNDPNWLQAVDLGRVIAPEHPLFIDLDEMTTPVSEAEPVTVPLYEESEAQFESPAAEEIPAAAVETKVDLDWGDAPTSAGTPVSGSDDTTAVRPAVPMDDFAADSDAAATKLELARAYLDMGDYEGAKGMLEEVLGEGSAAQREEARKLLADIQ